MSDCAALPGRQDGKPAAARPAVKYRPHAVQMGQQFLLDMTFLNNVVDVRFFTTAFKLPLIR